MIFVFQQICWTWDHVDLTMHNTVLLDLWWKMLIKFSKQRANTSGKTINGYKSKFKTLSNLRWIFFRKLLLASEGNSLLMRYNTHTPWRTTFAIPTNKDHNLFSFTYKSCTWPRSGWFCWQNLRSGCDSEIDMAVFEYTFFQLCSSTE